MKKNIWFTAIVSGIVEVFPLLAHGSEAEFVDSGTTAWMLTSTALVLLMVPGLAMFYGGLVRTKNVLSTMMHSFVAMAVIGVLWVVYCFWIASHGDWSFYAYSVTLPGTWHAGDRVVSR